MSSGRIGFSVLSAFFLASCDFRLGLDIMNAGNTSVEMMVGSQSERVAPGLSFRGIFPAPEDHADIRISDGPCSYRYALPDLDREPWQSLIGDSFKLRWFSDGRLVAYPPTPDVRIVDNPQRASSDEDRTVRPTNAICR